MIVNCLGPRLGALGPTSYTQMLIQKKIIIIIMKTLTNMFLLTVIGA